MALWTAAFTPPGPLRPLTKATLISYRTLGMGEGKHMKTTDNQGMFSQVVS